jgi:hypothetical protein
MREITREVRFCNFFCGGLVGDFLVEDFDFSIKAYFLI